MRISSRGTCSYPSCILNGSQGFTLSWQCDTSLAKGKTEACYDALLCWQRVKRCGRRHCCSKQWYWCT